MTMESDAKEAAILKMLNWWGSQASRLTDQQIGNYLEAVDDMSLEAVEQSCKELRQGLVPRNNEFMPTPVELAINTRRYDRLVADHDARREMARIVSYPIGGEPPPGMEELGPTKIEIGGRLVDVSHLTLDEKIEALKSGRLPADEKPATPKLQRF